MVLKILEAKTISPYGFRSNRSWEYLLGLADKYGDIVSIHTDPGWDGSYDLISKARRLTDKEILAKGQHKTDEEVKKALDAGANYVLVVGRIPEDSVISKCLIEPRNYDELCNLPQNLKVVWNSRDLSDGRKKKETIDEVRKVWPGWLCQASNIRTVDDIHQEVNAVLVGSYLEEFIQSLK